MNGSTTGRTVAIALLSLMVGAGIALVAYNAGTQHAVTDGGHVLTAPPNAQVVYVRQPWGFGFGFFVPFMFFLAFVALLRSVVWRGSRRGWYPPHHGYCGTHRGEAPGPDVTGTTV